MNEKAQKIITNKEIIRKKKEKRKRKEPKIKKLDNKEKRK